MQMWNNESEAREQIKDLVTKYYQEFKKPNESKDNFKPGDRISYASRVYDEKEMQMLTDAMLDFWLTTGRFSEEFEKKFIIRNCCYARYDLDILFYLRLSFSSSGCSFSYPAGSLFPDSRIDHPPPDT